MTANKKRSRPIRAWRVWRVPAEGDHPAPVGTLYGPMNGGMVPWVGGIHRAVCTPPVHRAGWERGWDGAPHRVPGARCECGIRGDLDLAALFDYGARAAAAGPDGAELRARGLLGWRGWREVIGEVDLLGRCLPPRLDDTPTTLRAERARVGRRVFFARPLWDLADAFEEVHPWSMAVRVPELPELWHYLGASSGAAAAR